MLELLAATCVVTLMAQEKNHIDLPPTCNMCSGTYYQKSDESSGDQRVRDIEIGKAYIAIGVVIAGGHCLTW